MCIKKAYVRGGKLDDLESRTAGCNLGMSHVFIQQLKRTVATLLTACENAARARWYFFLHASRASRVVASGLYQILYEDIYEHS